MSKPIIQIGNEVREMTAAEQAEWQAAGQDAERFAAAAAAAADAKAAARASALAKLAELGLNESEINALVG